VDGNFRVIIALLLPSSLPLFAVGSLFSSSLSLIVITSGLDSGFGRPEAKEVLLLLLLVESGGGSRRFQLDTCTTTCSCTYVCL
jgi:hypothetical protein